MKIFVGNVDGADTTPEELAALFKPYGTVMSCAVMKQFAFVHMRENMGALRAIEALHGHELRPGRALVVEMSRPRPLNTWKIFVGNVSAACTSQELRSLFERRGRVIECDVVKGSAGRGGRAAAGGGRRLLGRARALPAATPLPGSGARWAGPGVPAAGCPARAARRGAAAPPTPHPTGSGRPRGAGRGPGRACLRDSRVYRGAPCTRLLGPAPAPSGPWAPAGPRSGEDLATPPACSPGEKGGCRAPAPVVPPDEGNGALGRLGSLKTRLALGLAHGAR